MPVARVNDIELNYKLEGDGEETIVLVNGLADDLETWVLQLDDFLAAGYRILRFDNWGIGTSSKPAGPYTSRMLADDAKALVDPVAFVVPSIIIGVVSTAFTSPATASRFLSTFGILGVVIMYLAANVALIAVGIAYPLILARLRPRVLERAPALLEGGEDQAAEPLPMPG